MNLYSAYCLVEKLLALEEPGPLPGRYGHRKTSLRKQRQAQVQAQRQSMLQELAGFVRAHPKLKSILIPQWEDKYYAFGMVTTLVPPLRWHDPLIQEMRERYLWVYNQRDGRGFNSSAPALDPVYQQLSRPWLKELMFTRKMPEAQYQALHQALANESAANTSRSTALAPLSRSLSRQFKRPNSQLPVPLAAANLKVSLAFLRKARKQGQESALEKKAVLVEEAHTSWAVANRLAGLNIAEELWPDIVDTAREVRMSVACMVRAIYATQDVLLVIESVGSLESLAADLADSLQQPIAMSWNTIMEVYVQANGSVDRTLDMMNDRYPHASDENDTDLRATLLSLVGDKTPGCNHPYMVEEEYVLQMAGLPYTNVKGAK